MSAKKTHNAWNVFNKYMKKYYRGNNLTVSQRSDLYKANKQTFTNFLERTQPRNIESAVELILFDQAKNNKLFIPKPDGLELPRNARFARQPGESDANISIDLDDISMDESKELSQGEISRLTSSTNEATLVDQTIADQTLEDDFSFRSEADRILEAGEDERVKEQELQSTVQRARNFLEEEGGALSDSVSSVLEEGKELGIKALQGLESLVSPVKKWARGLDVLPEFSEASGLNVLEGIEAKGISIAPEVIGDIAIPEAALGAALLFGAERAGDAALRAIRGRPEPLPKPPLDPVHFPMDIDDDGREPAVRPLDAVFRQRANELSGQLDVGPHDVVFRTPDGPQVRPGTDPELTSERNRRRFSDLITNGSRDIRGVRQEIRRAVNLGQMSRDHSRALEEMIGTRVARHGDLRAYQNPIEAGGRPLRPFPESKSRGVVRSGSALDTMASAVGGRGRVRAAAAAGASVALAGAGAAASGGAGGASIPPLAPPQRAADDQVFRLGQNSRVLRPPQSIIDRGKKAIQDWYTFQVGPAVAPIRIAAAVAALLAANKATTTKKRAITDDFTQVFEGGETFEGGTISGSGGMPPAPVPFQVGGGPERDLNKEYDDLRAARETVARSQGKVLPPIGSRQDRANRAQWIRQVRESIGQAAVDPSASSSSSSSDVLPPARGPLPPGVRVRTVRGPQVRDAGQGEGVVSDEDEDDLVDMDIVEAELRAEQKERDERAAAAAGGGGAAAGFVDDFDEDPEDPGGGGPFKQALDPFREQVIAATGDDISFEEYKMGPQLRPEFKIGGAELVAESHAQTIQDAEMFNSFDYQPSVSWLGPNNPLMRLNFLEDTVNYSNANMNWLQNGTPVPGNVLNKRKREEPSEDTFTLTPSELKKHKAEMRGPQNVMQPTWQALRNQIQLPLDEARLAFTPADYEMKGGPPMKVKIMRAFEPFSPDWDNQVQDVRC